MRSDLAFSESSIRRGVLDLLFSFWDGRIVEVLILNKKQAMYTVPDNRW